MPHPGDTAGVALHLAPLRRSRRHADAHPVLSGLAPIAGQREELARCILEMRALELPPSPGHRRRGVGRGAALASPTDYELENPSTVISPEGCAATLEGLTQRERAAEALKMTPTDLLGQGDRRDRA